MNRKEWDNACGVYCPRCHHETMRVLDGLCSQCQSRVEEERVEKLERRKMKRYYTDKLRRGEITLSQMRRGEL